MSYAICIVPLAAVRLKPDHRAEMTNQYLFGECGEIKQTTSDGWLLLHDNFDAYIGWCRSNQFFKLDKKITENKSYTADWVNDITVNEQLLKLPFGCNLSIIEEQISGLTVTYRGNSISAKETTFSEKNINAFGRLFLNTAYLWGGKSTFGIDCSGFVQTVFKMMDIPLLRDANMQVNEGSAIGFLQEAVCGDLAFFDDDKGEIIHVGILLNDHEILHSSAIVRIDRIDNEGIIHSVNGLRTHRLRTIKRMTTK